MASRGTAIDRVLAFYRTASPDTVRVTHQLAQEIVEERGIGRKDAGRKSTKGRKPRSAQTGTRADGAVGTAATAAAGGGS